MNLRKQLGKVKAQVLCSLLARPVALGHQAPLVSFCFDDFPRTAYLVGGMLLRSFGAHGTFYASAGLMNTTNALGAQFTHEDLLSLIAEGHELGCHTYSHVSCRSLPLRSFEREVKRGRDELLGLTGLDAANFAYPHGHLSLRSKRLIGPQMRSCRGIYGGVNEQFADLNLLRANSLYGGVDQLSNIEALIARNVSSQGWLIFYTHDVRENPSAFGCTPALLDRTLLHALEKGCRIASVREVIETLPELEGALSSRPLPPMTVTPSSSIVGDPHTL